MAERKVAALLEAGAEVRLLSPEVTPQLAAWADEGRLRREAADFYPSAVNGCFLVFCATDSPQVNQFAAAAAKEAGALVNAADAPELCDFTLPARLVRGNLSIAVSTGGQSPALARELRDELCERIGPEYGLYLEIVGRIRLEWTGIRSGERRALPPLARNRRFRSEGAGIVAHWRRRRGGGQNQACYWRF